MKQRITKEQWDELDQEQQTKICDLFEDFFEFPLHKNGPHLNIGQMLAYLGESIDSMCFDGKKSRHLRWNVFYQHHQMTTKTELCDALWEAVKYKLCV